MKTILFFIPSLGGGGAERVLVNLVNNLDQNKYRITVQTLFDDNGVNKVNLSDKIEYKYCFKRTFRANAKILTLFSPCKLYNYFIGKRYDIVVSYLEGPTTRIVSGCPYQDSRLINWVHVEQHTLAAASYSYRSQKEFKCCMERYDRTICVAESVKHDLERIIDLNHPCHILYNVNEQETIVSKGQEAILDVVYSDSVNIISVGRLVPEKGFDRLVKVHKRLLDLGIKHNVYILGTGNQESYIKGLIDKYEVTNTFHLLGFHSNPYKYISKADLFVCSSRREGFSTAVTEALLLNIPVVSTLCSGAHELLGNNNEFGIVTTNDEEGLFNGLYQILTQKDLLPYYKLQATERAKKFSKERTVKSIESFFDSL